MPRLLDSALFDRQDPVSEAVRCAGASLTTAEVSTRARALAGWLNAQGIGRGDLVGIYMHKSIDLPAVVFGVLASGAGYVPIDPKAPIARVTQIATICDLPMIIVGQALVRHGPALRAALPDTRLLLDAPGAADNLQTVLAGTNTPANADRSPDDTAYILFTSGSTGTPKGIVHTHASALAYADACAALYDFRPSDRMAALTPLHFDMSTFEMFAGLSRGATVVLVPEAVAMMPASLTALLEAEQITTLYAVPYALTQMLRAGALDTRDLHALRLIAHAGDVMPPSLANALREALPGITLSNSYGPTELNQVTAHTYGTQDVPTDRALPIGQPLPDTHVLIDSTTGELLISTPAMMQGYWRAPEVTKSAFSMRAGTDGQLRKYYHTGDIARQDTDGTLHFHGRIDRQVKVRGYRVELDEVELAMGQCQGVLSAATIMRADTAELAGFVVAKPGRKVTPGDMIADLARRLPAYAVPRHITVLDSFPQTSTGKVDRKMLVDHV